LKPTCMNTGKWLALSLFPPLGTMLLAGRLTALLKWTNGPSYKTLSHVPPHALGSLLYGQCHVNLL
jgi:hypothetical protein